MDVARQVALAFGVYPRLFAQRRSPATKATSTSPGFGAVTEAMVGAGAQAWSGAGAGSGATDRVWDLGWVCCQV